LVNRDPASIVEMCDEVVCIEDGGVLIIVEPIMIAAKYNEIAR